MIYLSQCQQCGHFKPDDFAELEPRSLRWNPNGEARRLARRTALSNRVCAAFPNGIPEIIFGGVGELGVDFESFDHNEPYPGDNGIQFEKRRRPAKKRDG